MYNMMFLKKFLCNALVMGAGMAGVFALLSMPLPYVKYALIGLLGCAALGVLYFMTLTQIENEEREKRYAEREAERKAEYAKLRS